NRKIRFGLALAAAGGLLLIGTGQAHAPDRAFACYAVPQPLPAEEVKLPEVPVERAEAVQAPKSSPERQALVAYLSHRFYIAPDALRRMVATAYRAARSVGMDPLLVLAVISVESSFNPIAQSVMGAKGLMQIIPKYHRAKLMEYGGEEAALDPESNILVGTRILHEYVYRAGTLKAGLQLYNGASDDPSAQYAQKVLAERERLDRALRQALREGRRPALDAALDAAPATKGS
ncbi:MAG TPA: transglycosylase SLT domain-containing protein, partial [Burkholderiales bacterium]|nr:transglycosylase SLT domain-containing protein [Burkholderiales bacterium]